MGGNMLGLLQSAYSAKRTNCAACLDLLGLGARPRGAPAEATEARAGAPDREGDKTSPVLDFRVTVRKRPGDLLGAGLGNSVRGAIVCSIREDGLLSGWNRANPHQLVGPGFIIKQVNEVTGYWAMLDELRKPGVLSLEVSGAPPPSAAPNWIEEIEEAGRKFEAQGGRASFMVQLKLQDPGAATKKTFASFPTARAGECGIDQCAICLEDVDPDDQVVELPCSHFFHSSCAARWLVQSGKHAQGKRQCCPLCCRRVFGTADGGLGTSD